MSGSLTIVGPMRLPVGVAELMGPDAAEARQATIHRIECVEKVYHLIEEPDIRGWLTGVLPRIGVQVEDLSLFYATSGHNINEVHLEVAEWIMQSPRLGMDTAVVFSGRAELCVPPAAAAGALALQANIPIAMLPHVFTLPVGA